MPAHPILIVEDEHALGVALEMLVRRMGHLPTLAASAAGAFQALERHPFSAIVLDIGLPDQSGLVVLEKLRARGDATPVLVITAHATLDHAIHAQKSGATGYLTKPIQLRDFERTLAALLEDGVPLAAAAAPSPAQPRATMIGAAPCLREAFSGIARACAGDLPALITGPSGVGKSLAARVIHANSGRAAQPLHFIEAAGLSDPAELPAGTVTLEEVSAAPHGVQAALAQWLSADSSGKCRILATTSADPLAAVKDGSIRTDLFYALATLTIPLPPLRERSGDIPALAAFFLGLSGKDAVPELTAPALDALQAYPWPGNVRELKHVLDYAATVCGSGPVFLNHLPAHLAGAYAGPANAPGELETVIARWLDAALAAEPQPAYDDLLDRLEAVVLDHLMALHEHKPTRLAAALRIHRGTLRKKLQRAGLAGEET